MWSFILSRLRGDAPLHTVFWRDMVIVGTGLNVLATAAALIMLVAEAPGSWPVLTHLVPQPWNLFVVFAVWRSAGHVNDPTRSLIRMSALCWLALMIIV
jgi:hypothetical protein